MYDALIVYYDEINMKGKNKGKFELELKRNIIRVIEYNFKVKLKFKEKNSGFFIFELPIFDDFERLVYILKHIPGISNFVIAESIDYDYTKFNESYLRDLLKSKISTTQIDFSTSISFKVDTKRHFKSLEFKSQEINAMVGDLMDTKFKVSLKNPDFVITLSITKSNLYFSTNHYQGVGGLPIGVSGHSLCLLSGGIDSPVASFMMMKRGLSITYVHFQNRTLVKGAVENKIKDLVNQLAKFQGFAKLIIIPFDDIQKQIIANVESSHRMLLYRSMMLKLSEIVCNNEKIYSIVLGDNLAQVASQTISNLKAVYAYSSKLILSPLMGLNKVEIMKIARDLGTYEISIKPYPDCCSLLIAKRPSTSSRKKFLDKLESNLEFDDGYLEQIVNQAKIINF